MALPPQRLLGDDLFVINRIESLSVDTYKVNASDIGIYLLEAPRPPGSHPEDKFVNDGELNVYGNIRGLGDGSINLHSANEWCEGKLKFSEDFYVTGVAMDVAVEVNYKHLTGELSCDTGGIDGSGECMKLDMVWLSENIICSGKGLDNSCLTGIGIDLCDHSGLQFPAEGCLQVNLCGDGAIIHHPADGCLTVNLEYFANMLSCNGLRPADGDVNSQCIEIDMDWLSNNIRCGDLHDPAGTNSGLIDGGGCIEIDPCWVGDRFNVDNPQYTISQADAVSIDTDGCRLRVNEDWLIQWAKDNIKNVEITGSSLCLKIDGNKNLFEDDVVIDLPKDCMETWAEGVIDNKIKDITIAGSSSDCLEILGNPNVAQGEVKLKLNETCLKDLIAGEIKDITIAGGSSDCLEIVGNANVAQGQVKLKLNETCLKDLIAAEIPPIPPIPPIPITEIKGDSCINVSMSGTVANLSFDTSCAGTTPPPPGDGKLKLTAGTGITINRTGGNQFGANQTTGSDVEWTINATSSGSGSPPTGACPGGGLETGTSGGNTCLGINLCGDSGLEIKPNGCLTISKEPASCPVYDTAFTAKRFYTSASGTGNKPAIVIGTDDAKLNEGSIGLKSITSNKDNPNFNVSFFGGGWDATFDSCGGPASGAKEGKILAVGYRKNGGTPEFGSIGLAGGTFAGQAIVHAWAGDDPGGGTLNGVSWGEPQVKHYNRLSFDITARRGIFTDITPNTDARANVNLDNMVDDFVGFSDGGDYDSTSGLFRWTLKKNDNSSEYPSMYMDAQELGTRFPSLVDWAYGSDAYDTIEELDDDGNVIRTDYSLKEDLSSYQMGVTSINWASFNTFHIAVTQRMKRRIDAQDTLIADLLDRIEHLEAHIGHSN